MRISLEATVNRPLRSLSHQLARALRYGRGGCRIIRNHKHETDIMSETVNPVTPATPTPCACSAAPKAQPAAPAPAPQPQPAAAPAPAAAPKAGKRNSRKR